MDKYARHGSVPKEAKNAAGGVYIGGGSLKICSKAVRKRKLGVHSAQDVESLWGTRVS